MKNIIISVTTQSQLFKKISEEKKPDKKLDSLKNIVQWVIEVHSRSHSLPA